MAQDQVFITVGATARKSFEAWVDQNNYREKRVFLAGWLTLLQMSHEDRVKMFSEVDQWAEKGCKTDELPLALKPMGPPEGRLRSPTLSAALEPSRKPQKGRARR